MNTPPDDRSLNPEPNPRTLLNRRFLVAVGLLVGLLLLNQMLVQPSLLRIAVDAPTINIAGRQRMYSQRLTKAALALVHSSREDDRRRYRTELNEVSARWSEAHESLRTSPETSAPRALTSEFEAIQPSYERMWAAIAQLERGGDGSNALATLLATEPVYLERMEGIVARFEQEARSRVARLVWTGWIVSALIVGVLMAIGRTILRPAVTTIEAQFQALAGARDELEERVRQRTLSLETANARHRALLEMFSHASRTNTLGEMVSSLAHELGQPLGAIANYAEGCLVELDSAQPDRSEIQHALQKILATTLRAGGVIKRVRGLVRRGEIERKPIAAHDLLAEVGDFLQAEARARGITLLVEAAPDLPCVNADAPQIQQVLINLVRNAFDAVGNSEPSKRQVLMKSRSLSQDAVEFAVIDHGEGIPSAHLDRLFEAYFSTRAEGMGMGLAISRTIVEAHDGILSVQSVPGIETTFRFTLPVAEPGDHG